MDVATTPLVERVARALAGIDHSVNAEGVERSAATSVDETWQAYLPQANAVLRAIREPSPKMSASGDPQIWSAMVGLAIEEADNLT